MSGVSRLITSPFLSAYAVTFVPLTNCWFLAAPEEEWNNILIKGLTIGAGEVSPEELDAVLKKRIERTLIRTEGGSYQQRILTEYLKGIESRAEDIVQAFRGKQQ